MGQRHAWLVTWCSSQPGPIWGRHLHVAALEGPDKAHDDVNPAIVDKLSRPIPPRYRRAPPEPVRGDRGDLVVNSNGRVLAERRSLRPTEATFGIAAPRRTR